MGHPQSFISQLLPINVCSIQPAKFCLQAVDLLVLLLLS